MNSFTGIVSRGHGRGRELGYPTANIPLTDDTITGVYAARVVVGSDSPYMAAVFADPARGLLEAHVLDFSNDLYGTKVTIELLKKIREGEKYENDAELRKAIARDVVDVRTFFDTV